MKNNVNSQRNEIAPDTKKGIGVVYFDQRAPAFAGGCMVEVPLKHSVPLCFLISCKNMQKKHPLKNSRPAFRSYSQSLKVKTVFFPPLFSRFCIFCMKSEKRGKKCFNGISTMQTPAKAGVGWSKYTTDRRMRI